LEGAATDESETVDAAMQLSCSALIALQSSLSSMSELSDEYETAAAALRAAIESTIAAVSELQDLSARSARSALAYGFVMRRLREGPG
jgi:hypothetical protein